MGLRTMVVPTRSLILGSASHLRNSAYLPPHLPLVADYFHVNWDVTSEDEDGVVSALLQRDQAPRVRLQMPILSLQKFIYVHRRGISGAVTSGCLAFAGG